MFSISSSSQAFQLSSSFFFQEVGLGSMYLRARGVPLVPVLPPHPAPSELPTEDPTLGEDVTGTATPLSTKPCANPAKRQIRHQKLSLWEHAAVLSANEPANRWQHVSSVPQCSSLLFFFFPPPFSFFFIFLFCSFPPAWAQAVCLSNTVILLPNRACLSRSDATSPLSRSKDFFFFSRWI